MAGKNSLSNFLKAKAHKTLEDSNQGQINWEERKKEWLGSIEALYGLIKNWLGSLEEETLLTFVPSEITLHEPPLGQYNAKVLTIVIGGQRISFVPKGTLIVGGRGRIDIEGHKGMRTIILRDGEWSIVQRGPKLKSTKFNKSSFQNVLDEVME